MAVKSTEAITSPLCPNGQTAENMAFPPLSQNGQMTEKEVSPPLCPKRQTEKQLAGKGMQLNTNILNTKELSTYSFSSQAGLASIPVDERQDKSRDEEENQQRFLRERLKVDNLSIKYSPALAEAVFDELYKRGIKFKELMTARALEQICHAIMDKQRHEPIRMLPNLINTYLGNIMLGIKAAGNGGEITQCCILVRIRTYLDSFNRTSMILRPWRRGC